MIDRLPMRLQRKIRIDEGGCWLWLGYLDTSGYGMCGLGGKGNAGLTHRFTYKLLVGEIPPGLQLDHLCRVRSCVNPAHLEPVTALENARRTIPFLKPKWRKICKNGHDLTGPNGVRKQRGVRCLACHREYENARYHAKRAING